MSSIRIILPWKVIFSGFTAIYFKAVYTSSFFANRFFLSELCLNIFLKEIIDISGLSGKDIVSDPAYLRLPLKLMGYLHIEN